MGDEPQTMQDDLIIRHLTGETSPEEEKELQRWLAQLPDNEHYYNEVKKVFELGSHQIRNRSNPELNISVDQEWKKFVTTVERKETPVRTLASENSSPSWLRIAAAVLVLLASGFVINYFVFRETETQFQTASNTLPITLPDGSKIILNQHSQLSYSSAFGEKDRKVILKGEGFFEVERDTQKPFVIEINDAQVEVLGTSFNVQNYDSRKEIEVTVQTGVVKFSVPEAKKEVKLKAGEKGVYIKAKRELSSTTNQDINFLAWNTRKLVFTDSDLRSVLATISQIYQVNIILPASVPNTCVVTVTFDHQTLESVLNVLKTTLNLEYRINGNQIEIISAGC